MSLNLNPQMTFKHLVYLHMQQLTNFPYIEKDFDALTDYELLCLVVKYLNDVIKNSNEQNESIMNLYNAFMTLQDYVNEYFDEHFPQLVNDKLEEMAEDGTLENLLNDAAHLIKVYDTYEEMMEDSETFTDGLRLKVFGYNTINDGGNNEYYVTSSEIEDLEQVELENGLFLTKINNAIILDNYISHTEKVTINDVEYIDWLKAFQYIINKYEKPYIILLDKVYYISDTLNLNKDSSTIIGINRITSRIKLLPNNESLDYLVHISQPNCMLSNLYIDGNEENETFTFAAGVYTSGTTNNLIINNINIKHIKGHGMFITGTSYDSKFTDITVDNIKDGDGIRHRSTDCMYSKITISNIDKNGLYVIAGNNLFNQVKVYLTGKINDGSDTGIGIFVKGLQSSGYYAHSNRFINCEVQECGWDGFRLSDTEYCQLIGCYSDSNGVYKEQSYGFNINNSNYNIIEGTVNNKEWLQGTIYSPLNVSGYYNNIKITAGLVNHKLYDGTNPTKFFTHYLINNQSSTNTIYINGDNYLPLNYFNPMCFDDNNDNVANDFTTNKFSTSGVASYGISTTNRYQSFGLTGTTAVNDNFKLILSKNIPANTTKMSISFMRRLSQSTGLSLINRVIFYDSNNTEISRANKTEMPEYAGTTAYRTNWTDFYNDLDIPEGAAKCDIQLLLNITTANANGVANVKNFKLLFS